MCACALSLATTANAVPITIFNTGTDNSNNAWGSPNVVDLHYTYLVQPGSAVPVTVDDSGYPFGPWIANNYGSPGSRWIGPDQSSFGPAGNYVYRTTFTIPNNAILSTASITGDWATDDPGTDIRINGISTGQTSNFFTALQPFSVNSGFQLGLNTLDFYLTNAGGPTGLRVDHIRGSVQIPEPGAIALLCGGFLAVGVARYRRRRC
jgi:hypothetical protein